MTEVRVPKIGVSSAEAEVLQILASVGEEVQEGQPVVAIGADKVDVDVPSPSAGRVAQVLVAVGDTVSVGSVLLVLVDNA